LRPKRSVQDGRFKTESADDLFQDCIAIRLRRELRGNFDTPIFLKIGAVEPT
jgi:hypothetical protein